MVGLKFLVLQMRVRFFPRKPIEWGIAKWFKALVFDTSICRGFESRYPKRQVFKTSTWFVLETIYNRLI